MDLARVLARDFPVVTQTCSWRDSALYALGLGFGEDPLDDSELAFVQERDQRAVPSQCVVLGRPGFWQREPEMSIDWVNLLHGEHFFEIHRTLEPEAGIRASHRILAVDDKGPGRGALVYVETTIGDASSGERLASIRQTQFLRGDGGCGSHGSPPAPAGALPERAPDREVEIATLPRQALLYRLNGDFNPIHSDPAIARKAGFERPILHGLCTMGLACRAILKSFCDYRPERLVSMFVRFSKPVFPGETIRFSFFEKGETLRFKAIAVERGVVVLDRGEARLRRGPD